MYDRIVTQVRDTLYALKIEGKSLWKLTNLIDGQITKEDLANALTARNCPSVTSFNESFLFVTGGRDLNSFEYYEIAANQWTQAAAMNTAR